MKSERSRYCKRFWKASDRVCQYTFLSLITVYGISCRLCKDALYKESDERLGGAWLQKISTIWIILDHRGGKSWLAELYQILYCKPCLIQNIFQPCGHWFVGTSLLDAKRLRACNACANRWNTQQKCNFRGDGVMNHGELARHGKMMSAFLQPICITKGALAAKD